MNWRGSGERKQLFSSMGYALDFIGNLYRPMYKDMSFLHQKYVVEEAYGSQIKKGNIMPHLAEKRVIRTVTELRLQGLSLRQIARFLDKVGVSTKCGGRKWHPQIISRITKREMVS